MRRTRNRKGLGWWIKVVVISVVIALEAWFLYQLMRAPDGSYFISITGSEAHAED